MKQDTPKDMSKTGYFTRASHQCRRGFGASRKSPLSQHTRQGVPASREQHPQSTCTQLSPCSCSLSTFPTTRAMRHFNSPLYRYPRKELTNPFCSIKGEHHQVQKHNEQQNVAISSKKVRQILGIFLLIHGRGRCPSHAHFSQLRGNIVKPSQNDI